MPLILPAHVHTAVMLERARREFTSLVEAQARQADAAWMREIEQALRHVDSELRLIYWPYDRPDVPLRQGYYYVWRNNDSRGAPPTWIEIHDGEGNPAQPEVSRVLDIVAEADLWRPGVFREHFTRQRRELAREEARRAREDEERREHLRDLVNAATRVSIGFHDTGQGWAQNEDGRRRTKKKGKR